MTLHARPLNWAALRELTRQSKSYMYHPQPCCQNATSWNFLKVLTRCVCIALALISTLATAAPSISTQPTEANVDQGQQVALLVGATGSGQLEYQWRKNGVNIPNAKSSSYTISDAQPWNIGLYSVDVTDSSGTLRSREVAVRVTGYNTNAWNGLISYFPLNGNAMDKGVLANHLTAIGATYGEDRYGRSPGSGSFDGSDDAFYCNDAPGPDADGELTISLWFRLRSQVTGTAMIAGLSVPDQARFHMLIRDGKFAGEHGKDSDQALQNFSEETLTVNTWYHATIVTNGVGPDSIVRGYLNGVSVGSFASGTNDSVNSGYSYLIGSDPDSASLGRSNAPFPGEISDVRIYSRALGPASIGPLYQFESAPVITASPASTSVYASQPAAFSVTAIGFRTLTFQWRKNGQDIAGANGDSFAISNSNYQDIGAYDVIVSDTYNTATSDAATLNVVSPAPSVSIFPPESTLEVGGNVTLTSDVTGLASPTECTYQWRLNGKAIAKATSATLALTNFQRKQSGTYDVVVKSVFGTGISNRALVLAPPLITVNSSPTSVDIVPGGSSTFTADIADASSYQWYKGGVAIKNATGNSLTITNASASSIGSYTVTATTPAGKMTTAPAQLRVTDSGLLVYKLTATGRAFSGTDKRNGAIKGYLILDRAAQYGSLILSRKDGNQTIHWIEVHPNLHTHSTGPVPKSQTVISEMEQDSLALWFSGSDSLIAVTKTDSTVGPKTLKGFLNTLSAGDESIQEEFSVKLAVDAIHSAMARLTKETVEQAQARISQEMQLKGSALIED